MLLLHFPVPVVAVAATGVVVAACAYVAVAALSSIRSWRRIHALTTGERVRADVGLVAVVLVALPVIFVLARPVPSLVIALDERRGERLERAASDGAIARIRLWRWLGADVDGGERSSPLAGAARSGQLEAVRYLLASGAKVDGAANPGCTALALAASRSHGAVVDELLARGADPKRLCAQLSESDRARAFDTIRSALARAARAG